MTYVIPTIHVHCASDKSTVDYVTFMWETMRTLANHPAALKLSIHGIGPTAGERLRGMPNTQAYQVPTEYNTGSAAHGACIEHALMMTDDGDIHILADSDTVVLAKGWDDYLRIKLIDEGIGMIGASSEDIGGFSSGSSQIQMAKNIPTTTWSALSPVKKWRALKAMPSKDSNILVNTDLLAQIYNLPVGYQVYRDVGWQIPQYLYDNGISYQSWRQLKPAGEALILKGLSDYNEEYHVEGGVPFLAHQRGSLRHAYRSHGISDRFYNAIDQYLVAEKVEAKSTHWIWIPNAKNTEVLQVMAGLRMTRLANPIVLPVTLVPDAPEPPPAQAGTVNGWLKISLDGATIRARQTMPVTKTTNIDLVPTAAMRHLRLEGTVDNVYFTVPIPEAVPYMMSVRNMTEGPATVVGPKKSLIVPKDACWIALVDIDGVVHAS
jgi:hypothetical protein